jgi:branched-chain amino acid aminotransferase
MSAPLPPGARVPRRAAWINGRLTRGEEAALSLFDRGARDGEGLFETLRVYDAVPFAWERHLERLVLSAALLGFPVPASPATLRAALDEVLEAEGLRDAVARLTVTRGIPGGRPTRAGAWVEAQPLGARLWRGTRAGAVDLVTSQVPFEPGALGAHKTTSRLAYTLAREQARAANADEALLVSAAGEALEGASSNLFAVVDGAVLTPPLARGILPGITRAMVLALCAEAGLAAREATLARADLDAAAEVFVTNSVQEVARVGTLDGRALPDAGFARRLAGAYRARVREACG